MSAERLDELIRDYQHCLCVGLDVDPDLIPDGWNTSSYLSALEQYLEDVPAVKFNFAFIERFYYWDEGTTISNKMHNLRNNGQYLIADAKRCDVGHSAEHYAAHILDELEFDAVTVSPYMGLDSLTPFLQRKNKLTFALALTSNPGADDFQFHPYSNLEDALIGYEIKGLEEPLFVKVVKKIYAHAQKFPGDIGFVVGATRPEAIGLIRSLAPDAYLLVPGVGAQGGSVESVLKQTNHRILITVGRDIVYAYENVDLDIFGDREEPEILAIGVRIDSYIHEIARYMDF